MGGEKLPKDADWEGPGDKSYAFDLNLEGLVEVTTETTEAEAAAAAAAAFEEEQEQQQQREVEVLASLAASLSALSNVAVVDETGRVVSGLEAACEGYGPRAPAAPRVAFEDVSPLLLTDEQRFRAEVDERARLFQERAATAGAFVVEEEDEEIGQLPDLYTLAREAEEEAAAAAAAARAAAEAEKEEEEAEAYCLRVNAAFAAAGAFVSAEEEEEELEDEEEELEQLEELEAAERDYYCRVFDDGLAAEQEQLEVVTRGAERAFSPRSGLLGGGVFFSEESSSSASEEEEIFSSPLAADASASVFPSFCEIEEIFEDSASDDDASDDDDDNNNNDSALTPFVSFESCALAALHLANAEVERALSLALVSGDWERSGVRLLGLTRMRRAEVDDLQRAFGFSLPLLYEAKGRMMAVDVFDLSVPIFGGRATALVTRALCSVVA